MDALVYGVQLRGFSVRTKKRAARFYLGQIAAGIVLCISAAPARADQLWYYVQLTCLPQAQQFAARTFSQYNTPRPPGHDILTADELSNEPYTCNLPAIGNGPPVVIMVKGLTSAPEGSGYCSAVGREAVSITANGAEIATVDMAFCPGSVNTITSVQGSGVAYDVLHCEINFDGAYPEADEYRSAGCRGQQIEEAGPR
jgi:hypothetical protein